MEKETIYARHVSVVSFISFLIFVFWLDRFSLFLLFFFFFFFFFFKCTNFIIITYVFIERLWLFCLYRTAFHANAGFYKLYWLQYT
jgi:hypothetical protein